MAAKRIAQKCNVLTSLTLGKQMGTKISRSVVKKKSTFKRNIISLTLIGKIEHKCDGNKLD